MVLFVLITLKLALDITLICDSLADDFATPARNSPVYPRGFTANEGRHSPVQLVRKAMLSLGMYVALTIVADIFIVSGFPGLLLFIGCSHYTQPTNLEWQVYRVFTVWSRSIAVSLVPFLLAIADIVSGAALVAGVKKLQDGQDPGRGTLAMHNLVFFCFTLSLNILSTVLIALKLLVSERQTKLSSTLNLKSTTSIVVESGVCLGMNLQYPPTLIQSSFDLAAIYSAFLIAALVCNVLVLNGQYPVLIMMPGVVGLTFSLIIVRIGSGVSPHETSRGSTLRFAGHAQGVVDELELDAECDESMKGTMNVQRRFQDMHRENLSRA
ncbi:hypothetical protein V5O48_003153 [Marasmius crinis-equi]|uniref:Uncharacterized protein n=1 Tax=Marasmius crinis-equi TaxID=585013 RepID=A0ABR3FTM0_9AGAR